MGKTSKAKKEIVYRDGLLPERLGDILDSADESDLKVLIALMMAACASDGRIEEMPDLEELLGLGGSEIEASLKFWRGAGFIGSAKKSKKSASDGAVSTEKISEVTEGTEASAPKTQRAHRGGAVAHSEIAAYTTAELVDILEKRKALTLFINEAQRILGKTFNTHDTGILIGIIDQLGFDEEAVLAILAYCMRCKKGTARYAERVAISFYDEDITDTEQVIERIRVLEESAETVTQIRKLLGFGTRALSTTERSLLNMWTQTYGFGIDVIRLAYDIMVDRISEVKIKYMNTILETWYSEGLRTADDIKEHLRAEEEAKSRNKQAKSYDTDDFFEASLSRSYAEFGKDFEEGGD